ncbi:MAG: T9SS type A sorting domain-containing protein [Bacteroidales bacterium]|jgi:hypothetical protein|nr:T9SS type A sorting domain-containing protein [Bacteroidales bacterium]
MKDILLSTLLFLMTIALNVNSQILYTDITDTILTFPEGTPGILDDTTNYFYFDLNTDGTNDFYFYAHYWEEWLSPSAPEYPYYVMQLVSINNQGVPWYEGCAIDFGLNDTIQSESWLDQGLLYLDIFGSNHNCNLPFQDRYMGLRISESSATYYGWIRLDASSDTLFFKDMAYNSLANDIILAGQTNLTGDSEQTIYDEARVYFNGRDIIIEPGNVSFNSYSVFSHTGKEIETGNVSSNIIKLSHLKSGFYLVILKNRNVQLVTKIMIL